MGRGTKGVNPLACGVTLGMSLDFLGLGVLTPVSHLDTQTSSNIIWTPFGTFWIP